MLTDKYQERTGITTLQKYLSDVIHLQGTSFLYRNTAIYSGDITENIPEDTEWCIQSIETYFSCQGGSCESAAEYCLCVYNMFGLKF